MPFKLSVQGVGKRPWIAVSALYASVSEVLLQPLSPPLLPLPALLLLQRLYQPPDVLSVLFYLALRVNGHCVMTTYDAILRGEDRKTPEAISSHSS